MDTARTLGDIGLLEQSAEHARLALGCPFSSSAEYEAELIAERRAAGAYDSALPWRTVLASVMAGVLLAAFLFG